MVPASNKYEKVPFDIYKDRTIYTKIHQSNFPRFGQTKKTNEPAPTSYDTVNAISKTQWVEPTLKFKKDKRISYFE